MLTPAWHCLLTTTVLGSVVLSVWRHECGHDHVTRERQAPSTCEGCGDLTPPAVPARPSAELQGVAHAA